MQRLGINAIRVYNLDPEVDHNLCASIFNAVGIYMLLDVNSPLANESLNSSAPWNSYNVAYLNRTFAVVEAFKNYPNTLLFFAGNEVISDLPTGGIDPPYVRVSRRIVLRAFYCKSYSINSSVIERDIILMFIKAVTRDLKNYISKHSSRQIGVGYSAADVRPLLLDTWNYFQCTTTGDSNDTSRVDLFALNSYSWCNGDNIQTSTYDVLASDFANTSVPVFFSEYGCNRVTPRTFDEVQAIYGPVMTPSLSGGVVYEYSEEVDNYGLVVLNSNGSAQLRQDFDNLQGQFNQLNFTALEGTKSTNGSVVPPVCTANLITNAGFSTNFTIPEPPPGAQVVIDNGLTNPNIGNLVSVTDLRVSQTVQQSNGAVISGLAIKPLPDDQSNSPSGVNDSATPSTTTSAAPSATTTKNAAMRTFVMDAGASLVVLLATLWWL
jgi:1,3-beta-glucanosyltransferase GAS3